jgi:hypothetical protein
MRRSSPSESPTRSFDLTQRERSRIRDNSYEDDFYDKKEEFIKTYANTPITETEFTYGIEYEPTKLQYYDHNGDKHYDREIIYEIDNLKVTIEEFNYKDFLGEIDLTEEEDIKYDKNTCRYNLELSYGIYRHSNIYEFLNSKDKINDDLYDIEDLTDFFIQFIEKDNKEFEKLRKLYLYKGGPIHENQSYNNCAMTEFYSSDSKIYYEKQLPFINEIKGRPQITIGMSYGYFPDLINAIYNKNKPSYYLIYQEYVSKMIERTGEITDQHLILFGFMLVIIYSSQVSAHFFPQKMDLPSDNVENIELIKDIYKKGSKYLKAKFSFKPRSNLAESYNFLINEYSEMRSYIHHFYDLVNEMLESSIQSLEKYFYKDKRIPSLTSYHYQDILQYKLDILRMIENNSLRELLEKCDQFFTKKNIESKIWFMTYVIVFKIEDNLSEDILRFFTLLNMHCLLYKVFHPIKVAKIIVLKKEKIHSDCKVLDNYSYLYEGDHKKKIDRMRKDRIIDIIGIYNYANLEDAPILKYYHGLNYICTDFRAEIFEMIPENSNIIIELRSPEKFTDNVNLYKSIQLDQLSDLIELVFNRLKSVFF